MGLWSMFTAVQVTGDGSWEFRELAEESFFLEALRDAVTQGAKESGAGAIGGVVADSDYGGIVFADQNGRLGYFAINPSYEDDADAEQHNRQWGDPEAHEAAAND